MKNIATFIAIFLLISFGFAQNSPKIEFKAQNNILDYGTVSKKSDTGIRFLEFTNTGDAPLVITNILSTPGFTIASKPVDIVMPGKNGKIGIKYSMIPGPIRKTITVESNAVNYESGRIAIKIIGDVTAD